MANSLRSSIIRLTIFLVLLLSASPIAAQSSGGSGATEAIFFYHTDHVGTPLMMTDSTGKVVWKAESLPFGETVSVNEDVDGDGVKVINNLRFPGQYADAETGLHYNYFRNYDPQIGRYITSDPIGLRDGVNTYAYVSSNPLRFVDLLGRAKMCCRLLNSIAGSWFGQRHCYVIADSGTRYALYPENGLGIPRTDDPRDTGGECYDCPSFECKDQNGCSNQNECLRKAHNAYPIGGYSLLGPNSNTYAGVLARSCCKGGVPSGVHDAPGVYDSPPNPR